MRWMITILLSGLQRPARTSPHLRVYRKLKHQGSRRRWMLMPQLASKLWRTPRRSLLWGMVPEMLSFDLCNLAIIGSWLCSLLAIDLTGASQLLSVNLTQSNRVNNWCIANASRAYTSNEGCYRLYLWDPRWYCLKKLRHCHSMWIQRMRDIVGKYVVHVFKDILWFSHHSSIWTATISTWHLETGVVRITLDPPSVNANSRPKTMYFLVLVVFQ